MAHNTLQEERHWLKVYVPDPEFDKINAYLGCSNCGKRTDIAADQSYNCTTCSKPNCVSSLRVTFHCEVKDETGRLAITAFTEDSEKLFGQSAPDLFRLKKHTNDQDLFQMVKKRLQTSHFLIQVGPKATLSRNNVLQGILKKVEMDDKQDDNVVVSETSADDKQDDNVVISEASATHTPPKALIHKKQTCANNEPPEATKPINEADKPLEATKPINEADNLVVPERINEHSSKFFRYTQEIEATHVKLQVLDANDHGNNPKEN